MPGGSEFKAFDQKFVKLRAKVPFSGAGLQGSEVLAEIRVGGYGVWELWFKVDRVQGLSKVTMQRTKCMPLTEHFSRMGHVAL